MGIASFSNRTIWQSTQLWLKVAIPESLDPKGLTNMNIIEHKVRRLGL